MLLRATAFALTAVLSFAIVGGLALPAPAQEAAVVPTPSVPTLTAPTEAAPAAVTGLMAVLRVADLLDVMRLEGLEYGTALDEDLLAGQGGAHWQATVAAIYDADTMRATFEAVLARELAAHAAEMAPAEAFFTSDRGKTILDLELEARRALLEPAVEDAAKVVFADLAEAKSPRYDRIRRFAEVNDMIEANVIGALNANLAFYKGMTDGGALGDMAPADMVAEVWGQEAQVRADTQDWVYPFLALAYQPLSDEDLDAYIAFSVSPAGKALNTALYAAFDTLFLSISEQLGRAAALQITGQDI